MPNPSTTHLTQTSVDIYGAARLGAASLVREVSAEVSNITFVGMPVYDSSVIDQRIASANYSVNQLPAAPAVHERWLGYKQYEITNHPARAGQVLGNVTATLSDAKSTHYDGAVHYTPRITSLTDYYPFGAAMPGRGFSEGNYRYGFQGQEKDNEQKGEGNSINYKYRMHDARIGRFFAVDPLAASFPWNSSYAFSENRVVDAVELEGLESVQIGLNYGASLILGTGTETGLLFAPDGVFIYVSVSGSLATNASVSEQISITYWGDVKQAKDLAGLGYSFGIGAGEVVVGEVNGRQSGQYTGANVSFGLGLGASLVEVHGDIGFTWIIPISDDAKASTETAFNIIDNQVKILNQDLENLQDEIDLEMEKGMELLEEFSNSINTDKQRIKYEMIEQKEYLDGLNSKRNELSEKIEILENAKRTLKL